MTLRTPALTFERAIDEEGNRYGRLLVLGPSNDGRPGQWWLVRCDCGVEKRVQGLNLRRNPGTQSCGCKKGGVVTHGMTDTPTFKSWDAMRQRCSNPHNIGYKNYGGRGITVDPRWDSFENFLADMGERPEGLTLDRIDNDGNYERGNCRWATWIEQANNRRARI